MCYLSAVLSSDDDDLDGEPNESIGDESTSSSSQTLGSYFDSAVVVLSHTVPLTAMERHNLLAISFWYVTNQLSRHVCQYCANVRKPVMNHCYAYLECTNDALRIILCTCRCLRCRTVNPDVGLLALTLLACM